MSDDNWPKGLCNHGGHDLKECPQIAAPALLDQAKALVAKAKHDIETWRDYWREHEVTYSGQMIEDLINRLTPVYARAFAADKIEDERDKARDDCDDLRKRAERDAAQGQLTALVDTAQAVSLSVEVAPNTVLGVPLSTVVVVDREKMRKLQITLADTQAAAEAHDTAVAQRAREEEREACAKIAEAVQEHWDIDARSPRRIAAAIRDRKES